MNKDNTSDLSPDDKKKKKNGTMDKVVFGLLVGGAIGSVLGLTMAPDKGKKVRNKIKTKGGNAIEKGKEFLDENEDAVSLVASKSKGVFSFFTDRIFSKNKNSGKSSILDWLEDMEEIPSEVEEVAQ